MRNNRHGRKSPGGEGGSFWLSFSDMMSVLVLIFIFVIFSMMFTLNEQENKYIEARNEYQIALARAEASEQEQENLIILLGKAQDALTAAEQERDTAVNNLADATEQIHILSDKLQSTESELGKQSTIIISLQGENDSLSEKNAQLLLDKQVLQNNLDSIDDDILSLQAQLDSKRKELDALGADYSALLAASKADKSAINQYQSQLDLYKQQLSQTQTQLQQLLGVKTQIIEELSGELKRNGITVGVDTKTGSISLSGGALFDTGKTELKKDGMSYLDRVLPVYLNVVLSDDFRPYIAEIIIEGHTDSTGKTGTDAYLYNMELSQQRAESVADYVLSADYMNRVLHLSGAQASDFRSVVTVAGRSFSDLIYDRSGREDKDASRRVEIKFRLKDDETIDATRMLLELMGGN